jgi:hypothetical protein
MHILRNTLAVGLFIFSFPLAAQLSPMQVSGASAVVVPINTLVVVTPTEEITSIDMKVGEVRNFMVVNDVIEDGAVMIRRGSPVKTTVTWRTGKGIVGKSAKFELTFNSVRSGGREWKLRGSVRQFTAEEITSSPFFPTSNTSQYRLPSPSIPTQPAGINPSSAIRCITC